MKAYEIIFHIVLDSFSRETGTPVEYEYRFHPVRRWRFDAAFPERMIAVEIDGGAFSQGRHVRGAGFRKDCEKFNEAAFLGWRVFHFLPEQTGAEMIGMLDKALGREMRK
jgi:hypothetical protein